jgi:acylglycerol lipase
MVPKDQEVKAVLCFCHGYTDHASFVKTIEYARFVRKGIAVVTLEYEGHGRSDGQLGLIYDWDLLIDDTTSFFKQVTAQKFPGKKVFLMGEVRSATRFSCKTKTLMI